ncbi:MAG: FAD-dependent oxidoreductase [Raoultibacter sp.]|jgi:fumarate reductase flavoprotein subunit
MSENTGVSRRQFLAGVGVAGIAAAGVGVAGCSSGSSSSSSSSSSAASEGKWSWETAPDPITNVSETVDAEIVVVGAGMAGINTGSSAAFHGAKVIVLERTEKYQVRGADNGAVGTKFQKEQGINIDPAELLKYSAQWNAMQINQNLFKLWIYKSGPVFDDLIDLMTENGCDVVRGTGTRGDLEDAELFYRQYQTAHSWTPAGTAEASMTLPDGRWANNLVGDALIKQATDNGAEFVYNTMAQQLVVDDSGKVTGVIAENEDGAYVQYNASKGVVLCTGDIGGNEEMLRAWAPIVLRADASAYIPEGMNDGTGHKMALWAGAAVQHGPAGPMIHAVGGQVLCQKDIGWLMVNRDGKRFTNETPNEVATSNARMVQPGGVAWSIFDGEYESKIKAMMGEGGSNWGSVIDDETAGKMEEEIKAGTLWKADTLEDLADQLGIEDVEQFKATITRYNELCALGKDSDFLKDDKWMKSSIETPPFYASHVPAIPLTVPFGLNCNDQLQICTADDVPIEGLYAAGNTCGNFFADDYPLLTPGVSHGRAITFGRVLGEALAKGEKITI